LLAQDKEAQMLVVFQLSIYIIGHC
jgi:hypothetical protein